MEEKKTFTVRPAPENRAYLFKELERERKRNNRPSMSNTVEAILMEYLTSKNKKTK